MRRTLIFLSQPPSEDTMKHTLLFALSLLMAAPALAQPDRTSGDYRDVIWARDIGTADITVDGALNEPVWDSAESYRILWNGDHPGPGSGQWFIDNSGGLLDPSDPTDATARFLRKGNELYISIDANDQSIGGQRGFFAGDGVMMTLIRKSDRPETFTDRDDYFESSAVRMEMFYGWQHSRDTTAAGEQVPGILPKAWSTDFGLTAGDSSDAVPRNPEAWEYAATVDGTSNDDFNGGAAFAADNGYVMEMRIRLDSLGWDLTEPMSRMPFTIAVIDRDFSWPLDEAQFTRTRTWWQGRWLNNFNEGMAFIAGDPGVTVSSGAAPAYTEPEFTVYNGNNLDEPTLDGVLDEPAWVEADPQFTLQYQATSEELDAGLPGVVAPLYSFYFHPDTNPVIDPSVGSISMFYRGSKLYIGLDSDDQAVNGASATNPSEASRDGFRLIIRSRDSTYTCCSTTATHIRMDISIDSTGAAVISNVPDEVEVGTDLMAAVSMKGSSTVADPSDIDTGYQIEAVLDLQSIGYPADVSDEQIHVAVAYFDSDALLDDSQSYSTRRWVIGERANGASLYGLLDSREDLSVASEDDASEVGFRSLGSAPNPSTGLTRLRYELPSATEVTVEVFDVLGRRVQELKAGLQAEGRQSVEIDGEALGAGTYLYRVTMKDGASVTGRMTIVR